jgi:hypothetical protein|tara:strand:- start:17 stop:226 length:210 start_codon:yes stop_codon:yes gene_type:complete
MADTTITITIPEAQWATVQAAYAALDTDISASDVTATTVKNIMVNDLRVIVSRYDKKRQTISYSTFTPS